MTKPRDATDLAESAAATAREALATAKASVSYSTDLLAVLQGLGETRWPLITRRRIRREISTAVQRIADLRPEA